MITEEDFNNREDDLDDFDDCFEDCEDSDGWEDDEPDEDTGKIANFPRANYSLTIEVDADEEGRLKQSLDLSQLLDAIRDANPDIMISSIRFDSGLKQIAELGLYIVIVDESVWANLWVLPDVSTP